MREIDLGANGLEYLSHALRSNYATSVKSGLSKIDLSKGKIKTWVPDALQPLALSLKGLGPELDYDDDLWLPFREAVRAFLQESPQNLVFTQTRPIKNDLTAAWLRELVPRVKRFAVRCPDPASVVANWEKYTGMQAPVTEESIEFLIDEAFPFAQLYVFTSVPVDDELVDWLEQSEMLELTARTQALAVDVFDGSGFALWRRETITI